MTLQEYDALYRNLLVKKMRIVTSGGITILNKNIAQEEMSLEESLCSEENLRFGTCEASCFTVRIVYSDHSFVGEWLDVYQKIYTDSDGFLLNEDGTFLLNETGGRIQLESEADGIAHYGKFKVFSDKPTNDRLYRDLVCYDLMYDIINADVSDWSKNLTFPMTVKDFRDSFFEEIGVVQETTTLINDDFEIEGQYIVESSLSGKTIIEAICEINGVFGHINKEGKFEYISLPSADSITYPYYIDGSGSYEDYETEEISGIVARSVEGDVGTMVGTYDNVYNIDYNPLLFGSEGTAAMTTALTRLLNKISQITYRPFKISTYGNPMLPLGTNVTFNTRHQTVTSFVMSRFLRGVQGLRDDFSAKGNQIYPSDVNTIRNEITRNGGLTHKLTNDVNTLDSEIFDSQGNSRIQQTLNEIVLKVTTDGQIAEVKVGEDPDDGDIPTLNLSAPKVNITSDTIKFDNSGYEVKGDIYKTIITPDDNNVYASYKDVNYSNYYLTHYKWFDDFVNCLNERKICYFQADFDYYYSKGTQYETHRFYENSLFNFNHIIYKGIENVGTTVELSEPYNGDSYSIIIGAHLYLYNPTTFANLWSDGRIHRNQNGVYDFTSFTPTNSFYLDNYICKSYLSSASCSLSSTPNIPEEPLLDGYIKAEDYIKLLFNSGVRDISIENIELVAGDELIPVYGAESICWNPKDSDLYRGYQQWLSGTSSVWDLHKLSDSLNYAYFGSGSDKRLKKDFKPIDKEIIQAVLNCELQQFHLKTKKGGWSIGIIAQDLIKECEKLGINAEDYEICQKRKIREDIDMEYYIIDYSQYLLLKTKYLEDELNDLKNLLKERK